MVCASEGLGWLRMSMQDGSRNSNRSKPALGEVAPESPSPLPARARAYVPPTVIPRETEFRTFRMRRVEISPEADLRRQPTLLKLPKPAAPAPRPPPRRSRGSGLGWLSLAGASGGCLVWLLLNTLGGLSESPPGATPVSVTTASVRTAPGSAPIATAASSAPTAERRSDAPSAGDAPASVGRGSPWPAQVATAGGVNGNGHRGRHPGANPKPVVVAPRSAAPARERRQLAPSRAESSSGGAAAVAAPVTAPPEPKSVVAAPKASAAWPFRPPKSLRQEPGSAKPPRDEIWVKPKAPKVWLD